MFLRESPISGARTQRRRAFVEGHDDLAQQSVELGEFFRREIGEGTPQGLCELGRGRGGGLAPSSGDLDDRPSPVSFLGQPVYGGSGSAIGAIFGALMFRTIGDLLFVFNVDPLWQPLFQGLVLLAAVSVGSARLFQVRNRLELFP